MTPNHLRALAHAYDAEAREDPAGIAAGLRTAADEVDRLCIELGETMTMCGSAETKAARRLNTIDRLRAAIDKAPHGDDCLYIDLDGYRQYCTCWKAELA